MVTISSVVKDQLKNQPVIQEALNHEILSYTKLAKKLKPKIEKQLGKKVNKAAIVMALRRHADKNKKSVKYQSFSYSHETIKTDISYIILEQSPTILSKLEKIYKIIDFKNGGILNIAQGSCEIGITTKDRHKEKLLDLLYEEKILETLEELVSISLVHSKNFLFQKGVLYEISRFLSWENINLIDIILTKTEINLIIDKKDLTKCLNSIEIFAEKH